MSLYRKYRPKTFDELSGNEAEIDSLQKALNKKDRPHCFLLTGPSGCGKTTLARIAAEQLGADVLCTTEINSSNNRGIDTAREIIQTMSFIPPGSGVRVFIIDEVHKTTPDWQNAMLKPLEDTPPNVYFFLCTTDPQKLIKALKTRCTPVKVKPLDPDLLYRIMKRTAKKEGLEVPKEIMEEIADNSEGSPRTALVLLEKVSEVTDLKMMREIIIMGEDAQKEVKDLCQALLKAEGWSSVAHVLKNLKDVEPESVRRAVMGYMNAVLLGKDNKRAGVILELFAEPLYNTGRPGLTLACYLAMN